MAAYAEWFAAETVFLCVVDPGVSGTRPPIIVEAHGGVVAPERVPCSGFFFVVIRLDFRQ